MRDLGAVNTDWGEAVAVYWWNGLVVELQERHAGYLQTHKNLCCIQLFLLKATQHLFINSWEAFIN